MLSFFFAHFTHCWSFVLFLWKLLFFKANRGKFLQGIHIDVCKMFARKRSFTATAATKGLENVNKIHKTEKELHFIFNNNRLCRQARKKEKDDKILRKSHLHIKLPIKYIMKIRMFLSFFLALPYVVLLCMSDDLRRIQKTFSFITFAS